MVIEITIVCITILLVYGLERGYVDRFMKPDNTVDIVELRSQLEAQSIQLEAMTTDLVDLTQRVNKHMLKGALK